MMFFIATRATRCSRFNTTIEGDCDADGETSQEGKEEQKETSTTPGTIQGTTAESWQPEDETSGDKIGRASCRERE